MADAPSYLCEHCGHSFTHAVVQGGRFVRCPVCDGEVPVQRAPGEAEPELRVRRDRTVEGKALCPGCREALEPGIDPCPYCGFEFNPAEQGHRRRKRRPRPNVPSPRRWPKLVPALVVLLAAAGLVWLRHADRDPEMPGRATEERVAEARAHIAAALDAAHPMVDVGDQVSLRDRTDRMIDGRLAARDPSRLMIETETGPVRVDVERLAPASRILVDAAFRAEEIERRARREAHAEP